MKISFFNAKCSIRRKRRRQRKYINILKLGKTNEDGREESKGFVNKGDQEEQESWGEIGESIRRLHNLEGEGGNQWWIVIPAIQEGSLISSDAKIDGWEWGKENTIGSRKGLREIR